MTALPTSIRSLVTGERVTELQHWYTDEIGELEVVTLAGDDLDSLVAHGVAHSDPSRDSHVMRYGADIVAMPEWRTFRLLPSTHGPSAAAVLCCLESQISSVSTTSCCSEHAGAGRATRASRAAPSILAPARSPVPPARPARAPAYTDRMPRTTPTLGLPGEVIDHLENVASEPAADRRPLVRRHLAGRGEQVGELAVLADARRAPRRTPSRSHGPDSS